MGLINQTTGVVTPFVTGLTGPHSIDFVADVAGVPEPAAWAMMLADFGALGAVIRRRRLSPV